MSSSSVLLKSAAQSTSRDVSTTPSVTAVSRGSVTSAAKQTTSADSGLLAY